MGIRTWWKERRVRRAMEVLKRSGYAAATPSRLDNWLPVNEQINHLIGSASPRLRARVRDLVRNFPLFSRGVNAYTAYLVGGGARFQSLAVNPDSTPNHAARNRIESRFRLWMDEDADISGRMHFYEIQQLLCRGLLESGEGFFQFAQRRKYRVSPLCLLPLDPDRIQGYGIAAGGRDRDCYSGIEYDRLTGEALNYYVMGDGSIFGREVVVPADEMVHVYQVLRPGQLRGVTPLAPAILVARAMADYTQAELDASKMAAKYMAFVTTPDPAMFQASRGIVGRSGSTPDKPIEDLENSIIEYLRPGEAINFASPTTRPGDAFDRFCKYAARMIAVSIDVPYEILSGDYTGVNYSTCKAARGDTQLLLRPHHFMMRRFAMRVFRRWLDTEAVLHPSDFPGYWTARELYSPALWIPAGVPSVDPQRDGRAHIEAIAAGLESPQQAILADGRDPEEVVAQIAEYQQMLKAAGITLGKVSSSLSNNPAALEDQPAEMPSEEGI